MNMPADTHRSNSLLTRTLTHTRMYKRHDGERERERERRGGGREREREYDGSRSTKHSAGLTLVSKTCVPAH